MNLADIDPARIPNIRVDAEGGAVGRYFGCDLVSEFQPIHELSQRLVIGDEAFVRCRADRGMGLAPWNLFALGARDEDLVALDRLCRTVHSINHFRAPSVRDLFVNVHGRLLLAVREDHGRYYRRTLESLAIDPGRIVIETPGIAAENTELLARVLANYRRNGFRVAVNITRLEQAEALCVSLRPEFFKIDARHATRPAYADRLLAFAAQQGSRIIFKRIESGDVLGLLREAGAELAQGFVFAGGTSSPAQSQSATVR